MLLTSSVNRTDLPTDPAPLVERVGLLVERGVAVAAVAAYSPSSSTPERLLEAARLAREGAALLDVDPTNTAGEDRVVAASHARAGAALLEHAASVRGSDLPPAERDPQVSAIAYDAYDALVAAYRALGLA